MSGVVKSDEDAEAAVDDGVYLVLVNECYKNKQVTCKKYQQFCVVTCYRLIVNVWTFTINTILTATE